MQHRDLELGQSGHTASNLPGNFSVHLTHDLLNKSHFNSTPYTNAQINLRWTQFAIENVRADLHGHVKTCRRGILSAEMMHSPFQSHNLSTSTMSIITITIC